MFILFRLFKYIGIVFNNVFSTFVFQIRKSYQVIILSSPNLHQKEKWQNPTNSPQ